MNHPTPQPHPDREWVEMSEPDLSAARSRPYRFFSGPWENSDKPTICKAVDAGDPHILAVLTRICRPEEISRLVWLANTASQFDVLITDVAGNPTDTDNSLLLLDELGELEEMMRWHGGRPWARYAPLIGRARAVIAQDARKDGSSPQATEVQP